MPNASVAPTGAEKTALKIIASMADASRTRPDDCRTNNDEDCLDVSMSYSFWTTVKTIIWCMPPGESRSALVKPVQGDLKVGFHPQTGPHAGLFGCLGGCFVGVAHETPTQTLLNAP